MFAQYTAWLVDLAGVMGGAAKVGAVAPTTAVLTLGEWLAIFDIVVIGTAPCTEESIVAGAICLRVVEVDVGVVDLIVSHVAKGGCAVNDARGDVCVGIGVAQGFDACEALLRDVFKVHSKCRNVIGNAACPFVQRSVAGDLGLQGVVLFLFHSPVY
jgi:hypothetical protein